MIVSFVLAAIRYNCSGIGDRYNSISGLDFACRGRVARSIVGNGIADRQLASSNSICADSTGSIERPVFCDDVITW